MIDPDTRNAIVVLHEKGMSLREISRRLKISRNAVRAIGRQKGAMPNIARSEKIQIDPDLLRRLHKQCNGNVTLVREKLSEQEKLEVGYSTLTRNLRELGLHGSSSKQEKEAEAQDWVSKITYGEPSFEMIEAELEDSDDLAELLDYARNGRRLERKKAIVVLARKRRIPNETIAKVLHSSRATTRQYSKTYRHEGPSVLFGRNSLRAEVRVGDAKKIPRILELLHHKPSSFGINRTTWTQETLMQAYRTQYNETMASTSLFE